MRARFGPLEENCQEAWRCSSGGSIRRSAEVVSPEGSRGVRTL